ncbi:hypothetical protein GLOIN_2v1665227, partial [Rhizophagus irregularis DAOM 181602=DAOM 197198]
MNKSSSFSLFRISFFHIAFVTNFLHDLKPPVINLLFQIKLYSFTIKPSSISSKLYFIVLTTLLSFNISCISFLFSFIILYSFSLASI